MNSSLSLPIVALLVLMVMVMMMKMMLLHQAVVVELCLQFAGDALPVAGLLMGGPEQLGLAQDQLLHAPCGVRAAAHQQQVVYVCLFKASLEQLSIWMITATNKKRYSYI